MALVKCYECGKEVSDKAGACPSCGAPFKGQEAVAKATGRKTSPLTMGCLVIIVLGVIMSIFGSWQANRQSEETAKQEQARLVKLTPEQRAAETKRKQEAAAAAAAKKAEEEAAFSRAVVTVKALKDAARNPTSFTAHSVLVMDGSKAVCVEYRAQNGFGGMNVGKAVLTSDAKLLTDDADGFSKAWNRDCGGKVGTDYTDKVEYALK